MSDSKYPKAYQHPVTKQERVATNVAQEVSLEFDGYRAIEVEGTSKASDKTETDGSDKADGDTQSTTTKSAPKPTPPKGQEAK